jgi:hypothetical protein
MRRPSVGCKEEDGSWASCCFVGRIVTCFKERESVCVECWVL